MSMIPIRSFFMNCLGKRANIPPANAGMHWHGLAINQPGCGGRPTWRSRGELAARGYASPLSKPARRQSFATGRGNPQITSIALWRLFVCSKAYIGGRNRDWETGRAEETPARELALLGATGSHLDLTSGRWPHQVRFSKRELQLYMDRAAARGTGKPKASPVA